MKCVSPLFCNKSWPGYILLVYSVVELSNAPMCPVFAKLWEEMS